MDELLLDTTYLLPVFGIKLELKGFDGLFTALMGRFDVFYNPVSLVEAKWIVLKLARMEGIADKREAVLEAYRSGLKALEAEPGLLQSVLTDDRVEEIADGLLEEGARDYFDRLIYSTAARNGYKLLTEDRDLHEAARRSKTRPSQTLKWVDAVRVLTE